MSWSRAAGVLGVAVVLALAPRAWAFHSGGVAECNGCHTMHGSFEGEQVEAGEWANPIGKRTIPFAQYSAGPYLLKGSDQSSACLNCHAASDTAPNRYHIMTYPAPADGLPPVQLTPGGDFAWLGKTYTWSPDSSMTQTSKGDRHGHNVVAADFGLNADAILTVSPGGSYPASAMACSSCHDPHGKFRRHADGTIRNGMAEPTLPIRNSGSYADSLDPVANVYAVGVYRLLGGTGYQPKSLGSNAFSWQAFAAVAPPDYNRSEENDQTRVAYGRSVSLWCANCHEAMHSTFGTVVHPADQFLGTVVAPIYNSYVKTGDLTGTNTTSFSSLVPFQEDNTTNYTLLKSHARSDDSYLNGPISTDRVMCLSCHRAHASGWDSMMRWSLGYEFVTIGDDAGVPRYGDPSVEAERAFAQGRTPLEYQTAMYGRPATAFAPFQRVLCNKCHAKD